MHEFNWIGLIVFSTVLLGTPGPAVISLFYSGINYGLKNSLPYFFGVLVGFMFNLVICAFGVGVILEFETVYSALKIAMLGYICYLAYRIATSAPLDAVGETKPLHFMQGILLNLLNPKAYVAAMSAISQFSLASNYIQSAFLVVVVNSILALVFHGLWCFSGQYVRRLFAHPKWYRTINVLLAVLLVLSVTIVYLV